MNRYKFFFLCVGLLYGMHLSAKDYYATDFGVKADGRTLNTNSIQKGIDFVNEQGGRPFGFYHRQLPDRDDLPEIECDASS